MRVRWSDADPARIAFYPRLFEWYDLFASLGMEWARLFRAHGIVGVPIVESGSTFQAPVRSGDVVTIPSTVAWVRDETFRMEHEISVGGTIRARGFEVRAWVARPEGPGDPRHARSMPGAVARRRRGPG